MITVDICPFCGHHDIEITEAGSYEYAVDCPECQHIGPLLQRHHASHHSMEQGNPAGIARLRDSGLHLKSQEERK